MGSDSDMPVMIQAGDILKKFGISFEIKILSAHRSPDRTSEFAKTAKKKGIKVIIAGAGGAAHLAGVVAAHTVIPVIGVPMESKLDGLDSLLSTAQMPAGVPVATVSIGRAGAVNAAILAAEILGLGSSVISKKLQMHKKELVRKIETKNRKINKKK
ncbi:MAG: 5-(carboxyamino)imidazole ribonucleotide mutase [Candidatus Omnitrophica bacterium]|nr:5-(carboxyamino)imidazole ribonucleotide mutase [Candidatus Omnitrophota bacterium]